MGTRVTLNRQEIKTDKFADFMASAKDAAQSNMAILGGIVLAVIVLIGGIYFYQDSQGKALRGAQEALANAKTSMVAGNAQVAMLELRNIAEENSGSPVGADALYTLASANYLNNNFAEARKGFQQYLSQYSHLEITRVGAMGGVAACHENLGEYTEAADRYLAALDADPTGPSAEDYALGALRNALLAGDRNLAEALRQRITADFWSGAAPSVADRLFHEIQPADQG